MQDEKLSGVRRLNEDPEQEPVAKRESDAQTENSKSARKSRRKPELPEGTHVTAGQVVAIRRREQGWSQEELSWRSGLSRTQVGRIERDESAPTLKSIEGLESALGTELYDLFMEQKREQMKSSKKKARGPGSAIGSFEKELARKGLTGEDLEELLSEALRSAENRLKSKNSE